MSHFLYTNSSVHFPVKNVENKHTSWLQGAIGSKADIKSQSMLFRLNKSLVLLCFAVVL